MSCGYRSMLMSVPA